MQVLHEMEFLWHFPISSGQVITPRGGYNKTGYDLIAPDLIRPALRLESNKQS